MKTIIFFATVIFLITISCKEEERKGVCTACCDSNGDNICMGNFTDEMCTDYNKKKVGGHDWTFTEGLTNCPPSGPN